MSIELLLAAGGVGPQKLYVDDVFTTYLYQGASALRSLNVGLNFSDKGGLVWLKARTANYSSYLIDTVQGAGLTLSPTNSNGPQSNIILTAFGQNGFELGNAGVTNALGVSYVAWCFQKAKGFHDIVQYSGDGTIGRQVPHGLGVKPGLYIVKNISNGSDWWVWHNSFTNGSSSLILNATYPANVNNSDYTRNASSTTFTVGNPSHMNMVGQNYIAYLFGHDVSTEGIIRCGTFSGLTPEEITNIDVNLNWESQYLLVKALNTSSDWYIIDNQRGMNVPPNSNLGKILSANVATSETRGAPTGIEFTSSGFKASVYGLDSYMYMAVRRSNKPPSSGSQVYNAVSRTGTGVASTIDTVGFAFDTMISGNRAQSGTAGWGWWDRLRGVNDAANKTLFTHNTGAEQYGGQTSVSSATMNGYTIDTDSGWGYTNTSGHPFITYLLKRATEVFDTVCYTYSGDPTQRHSLNVTPELTIRKSRAGAGDWLVHAPSVFGLPYSHLNLATSSGIISSINNAVTSSTFSYNTNTLNEAYVTHLFASKSGISRIGGYTGNGTSQTINCGFSGGARFLLIKRWDGVGDWYVWDTARGIVAGNDPHISLNVNTSEISSDDSVDPDASGFIVNQLTATNINVNGAKYLYLAIA